MEKGVCRQPKAVPARGGFEPSAPSGRCSEGRIGRNREYCKRQRSKTTIFQPAFVDTNGCEWPKGERLKDAKCREVFPLSLCAAAHRQLPRKRWRLLGCGIICQNIRVNAQVGTRSPYSLPFAILPVPARSPFRFIRHWRRSTPNLAERSFQWGYGGCREA